MAHETQETMSEREIACCKDILEEELRCLRHGSLILKIQDGRIVDVERVSRLDRNLLKTRLASA